MSLVLRPSTKHEANRFIAQYHSHHPPVRGCKFAIACLDGERMCGVVVAERPKARLLDDGWTIELTRVCTDRTRHVASKLIAAAARAAFSMGARRVVSYVLAGELGTSYRAAGWMVVEENSRGGSWSREGRERDGLGLFGAQPKGTAGAEAPMGEGGLMCRVADWDSPSFSTETRRTARRQHQCEECCIVISPGEKYIDNRLGHEGSVSTVRVCLFCDALASALCSAQREHCGQAWGWQIGSLWQEVEEFMAEHHEHSMRRPPSNDVVMELMER